MRLVSLDIENPKITIVIFGFYALTQFLLPVEDAKILSLALLSGSLATNILRQDSQLILTER
jgi:hypothetical protein